MPPKSEDRKKTKEDTATEDGAERELVEKELVIGYLKSKLGRYVYLRQICDTYFLWQTSESRQSTFEGILYSCELTTLQHTQISRLRGSTTS
jgi:hypothetical protein